MKSKQMSLVIEDSTALQQEVNRLKAVLKVYANPDNWIGSSIWQPKRAGWQIAADVLAGQAAVGQKERITQIEKQGEIVLVFNGQEVVGDLVMGPPDETGVVFVYQNQWWFEEPPTIQKFRCAETNWEWVNYADWIKERGGQTE